MTRQMAEEVARDRGRPLLVSAKVPRNLEGCRVDGFDVETWVQEGLVDMFTLGSRSIDVDVTAYRRITEGRNIKLHPCFDDHHATDGYRYPPMEVLRGITSNWWQQGADGIMTFNWSNAPPETCKALGPRPRAADPSTGVPRDRQPRGHDVEGQDVRGRASRRVSLVAGFLRPGTTRLPFP